MCFIFFIVFFNYIMHAASHKQTSGYMAQYVDEMAKTLDKIDEQKDC